MTKTLNDTIALCAALTFMAGLPAKAHDIRDIRPAELAIISDYDLVEDTDTMATYNCGHCDTSVTLTIDYLRADDPELSGEIAVLTHETVIDAPTDQLFSECSAQGCSISLNSDGQDRRTLTRELRSGDDHPSGLPTMTHMILHGAVLIRLTYASNNFEQFYWTDYAVRQSLHDLLTDAH